MTTLFLWGITAVGITASIAVIYRRAWAFLLFAIAHGTQSVCNFWTGNIPLGGLYAFYVIMAIWGFIAWRKKP